MKKRNFNFSTKLNKVKRRLKYFAEIVSKKEKQMREANARKLNCSVDDINKFYTEMKDPSKQAMVFKGEAITFEKREKLYDINTWLEKIKVDGQEKVSQEFVEFVQREQPLLKEYEEVFRKGVTPDGGGSLLEVITTPDNYNWEVWLVTSWEASRYLGGAFGDSVPRNELTDTSSIGFEEKQISYKQYRAKWCIAWSTPGHWESFLNTSSFLFLIRQDDSDDKFRKVALEVNVDEVITDCWDAEDSNKSFKSYEFRKEIFHELEKRGCLNAASSCIVTYDFDDLKNADFFIQYLQDKYWHSFVECCEESIEMSEDDIVFELFQDFEEYYMECEVKYDGLNFSKCFMGGLLESWEIESEDKEINDIVFAEDVCADLYFTRGPRGIYDLTINWESGVDEEQERKIDESDLFDKIKVKVSELFFDIEEKKESMLQASIENKEDFLYYCDACCEGLYFTVDEETKEVKEHHLY